MKAGWAAQLPAVAVAPGQKMLRDLLTPGIASQQPVALRGREGAELRIARHALVAEALGNQRHDQVARAPDVPPGPSCPMRLRPPGTCRRSRRGRRPRRSWDRPGGSRSDRHEGRRHLHQPRSQPPSRAPKRRRRPTVSCSSDSAMWTMPVLFLRSTHPYAGPYGEQNSTAGRPSSAVDDERVPVGLRADGLKPFSPQLINEGGVAI